MTTADLTAQRVAVIGGGAMGSALIQGWLEAGVLEPAQLTVCDISEERLQVAREKLGVRACRDTAAVVAAATVVLLAVKPGDVTGVLQSAFAQVEGDPPLLLSIAAGVPLAVLESGLAGVPVIRVMPNTPAQVQAAASAFARGHHAADSHAAIAKALLGAVGLVHEVKESLLNAVTGLSGSGPAYIYVLIEALADGGVRCGLPRQVAQELAAQTVLGSAKMVLESGDHPGVLKDRVASPGGTTIAGLASLETNGFRAALIEAVTAATRRADELA